MRHERFISEESDVRFRFVHARSYQKGFSLIEMVVTLVVVSIGLLGLSTVVIRSVEEDRSMQANLSRTVLSGTLRKALTNRKSLKNTILNNLPMKTSVTIAPADYAAMGGYLYTDNRPYGIEIYDTDNQVLAGKGADASGTPATPVYYTTEGARCSSPGVGKCLIACTATVHIQGKADGLTPDSMVPYTVYPGTYDPLLKPDFFMIRYSIEYVPTTSSMGTQKKPLVGTVFVTIEDVEGLVP